MAEAFQQTAQCGGWSENKKTSQAGGLLVCGDDADKGGNLGGGKSLLGRENGWVGATKGMITKLQR